MGRIQVSLKKLQDRLDRINPVWEFIGISVFFLMIVFGVTIGIGTLTSGFHLVDDHQFAEWVYQMEYQGVSIWTILKDEFLNDIMFRYRPLYYITRVLSVYLFGINLTALSLMRAFEIFFSMLFLYYSAKMMKSKRIFAVLFVLVSWIGYQSVIWWKLGPQEAQCMLLFSIGLFCMLKWLWKKKTGWAVGSLISFFLMGSYKESFLILIPFVWLYVLYFELEKTEEKLSIKRIWKCVLSKLWYLIVLALLCVIPLIILVFFIGTNNYDGFGTGGTVEVYMTSFTSSLQGDLKWYARFGVLFIMILLTYWDQLKKLWKEIVLTMVILIPQFAVFGQTGISGHFLVPTTIGFAFFFILVIGNWNPLNGKRRILYILGILLLLAASGRVMLREADYFRYRGESVTTMLNSVLEMSSKDTKVLSCFRPNEEGNLTINYWLKDHDMDNVYYWTDDDKTITRVCDRNLSYPDADIQYDFEDMDIVVMYNQEDRHWCYDPDLDLSDFTKLSCGTLDIYIRNDQGIIAANTDVAGLKITF